MTQPVRIRKSRWWPGLWVVEVDGGRTRLGFNNWADAIAYATRKAEPGGRPDWVKSVTDKPSPA